MASGERKGFGPSQPVGRFANWDTKQATTALDGAITEIEREANVRMKCYDRWVADGRMTEQEAVSRLDALCAAWHILNDTPIGKKLSVQEPD